MLHNTPGRYSNYLILAFSKGFEKTEIEPIIFNYDRSVLAEILASEPAPEIDIEEIKQMQFIVI